MVATDLRVERRLIQVWDKVETGLRQGLGFLVPTGASILCAELVLPGMMASSTTPDSNDFPVTTGVSILCTELVLTGMASVLHSSSQGRQTAAAAPRRLPPRPPGGASSSRW